MSEINRRSLMMGFAIAGIAAPIPTKATAATMAIYKDPKCGCCSGWVEHVQAAGFETQINELADLGPVKLRLAIPPALSSCHTAEIEGYVIEGHVPATAIRRLLIERPTATGLAVAGMPVGSPGMEVPGTADEPYNVILFGPSGQRTYTSFKGTREIRPQP